MEEISASIIPKEEEDDDLLVYCMREGAKDILSKGKDEVYLLLQFDRKILMDSEIKFAAFFRVLTYFSSLLIFHLILLYISCHIYKKELIPKKKKYKTQQQIPTPLPCCHKTTACRAEIKVRMPLPHDARETCAVFLRPYFKTAALRSAFCITLTQASLRGCLK